MNLITLKSLETARLESIIEKSLLVKESPSQYREALNGKSLYMLFEKTSTRTSLAFGLGFNEIGGIYFIQRWQDSNFVVGEIVDETRYVARNVDIILARLKHNSDIECMGQASPIPVINGCCNKYHPTQGLADCMTVKEIFGTYSKTMLYVGIWNNVFNSLVSSFPRLGGKLIGVCPIINEDTISVQEAAEVANITENLEFYDRADITPKILKQLVSEVDIVYTDTWMDMEFFNNPEFKDLKEERIRVMSPFSISSELLENSHAVVMHDMPIHTGCEIEREVVDSHLETILKQAENRRHVAKGIFMNLLDADSDTNLPLYRQYA
ncbi:ornithine carbamoyltransferase [Thermodesulfobacteriota bacterium]